MQGKQLVMTDSKPLRYTLEKISKSLAIDVLLDLCHQEIGEFASEIEIANWFTQVIEPVARVRNDRPLDAARELAKFSKASAEDVALHGPACDVIPITSWPGLTRACDGDE